MDTKASQPVSEHGRHLFSAGQASRLIRWLDSFNVSDRIDQCELP